MTASRDLNGEQWVPGAGQNQVLSPSDRPQEVEQQENDEELADHECYLQGKGGLLNCGDCAEEELRSCWIWAR